MQANAPSSGKNRPEWSVWTPDDPRSWPDDPNSVDGQAVLTLRDIVLPLYPHAIITISSGKYLRRARIDLYDHKLYPVQAQSLMHAVHQFGWLTERIDWSWRGEVRVCGLFLMQQVDDGN